MFDPPPIHDDEPIRHRKRFLLVVSHIERGHAYRFQNGAPWVTLDGAGQSQSVLLVPNEAWLVGITSYVAGITVDPA